jgi:peptide/nickel transport system substrate-binding protein
MGKAVRSLHVAVLAGATAIALAACVGGKAHNNTSGGASAKPVRGGTLTILMEGKAFDHIDPQRVSAPEDLAFLNAYLTRSLTAYKISPDASEVDTLVPDMATDTGTSANGGRDWSFTLRDGMTWQDGTPVTCPDLKYGVSRTFATDVIVGGPSYARQYLDIPTNTVRDSDGTTHEESVYKGPYVTKGNDTAAFDAAVVCEGQTITFHLSRPISDFNRAVTMGMGAVPNASDTRDGYDKKIISDGPYKMQEYTQGRQLALVRNENWDKSSDPLRPAYPDKIVVTFGLDRSAIDQRMITNAGGDKRAVSRDPLLAADLATVFKEPRYRPRRVDSLSSATRYLNINASKVPDLKQRQAIAAALDRAQLRAIAGGAFAGDLADGVINPVLADDYASSGMWTRLFGRRIPDAGDPDYAKQLILESGKPMPRITYSYSKSPDGDKMAAAIQVSLGRAGITTDLNPIEPNDYSRAIRDAHTATELMDDSWAPDWPNPSTIIPALFTTTGVWNNSFVDDATYNALVDEALSETDRAKQAQKWKDLNKQAMQQAWVVPYLFQRDQRIAGSKVKSASGKNGQLYLLASFGSWPYYDMYLAN